MVVKTHDLYSFLQAVEIIGITPRRLSEIAASPYVEKMYQNNGIYFAKDSMKKLVLRGDVEC